MTAAGHSLLKSRRPALPHPAPASDQTKGAVPDMGEGRVPRYVATDPPPHALLESPRAALLAAASIRSTSIARPSPGDLSLDFHRTYATIVISEVDEGRLKGSLLGLEVREVCEEPTSTSVSTLVRSALWRNGSTR